MGSHRTRVAHLACIAAIAAATACGSSGSGGYDDGVRQRFVAACTEASSGRETACKAAYECITKRVPFADFKAADDAVAAGRAVDPKTAQVLVQCAAQSTPSP
jgi:hypothetical protein